MFIINFPYVYRPDDQELVNNKLLLKQTQHHWAEVKCSDAIQAQLETVHKPEATHKEIAEGTKVQSES